MADDVSLELWMDRRRLTALERVLKERGTDTQTVMQARLDELYRQYVPAQERTEINERMESERLAAERRAEEARRVCAFRVTEDGQSRYFSVDDGLELLDAAKKVRSYLTAESAARPSGFEKMFLHPAEISAERFDELAGIRMENTGKVTGVFDIDFDKREFSGVNIMDGWQTYAMGDVSAAVYHATRKQFLFRDQQFARLLDHLDGKEITSAGHLRSRNFSFSDEITEMDDKLNFYIDTTFDVDAAFGTDVCTDKNDDYINLYADYDMESGQVCDELTIILWKGDGQSEERSYTLNAAEKEVLLRKMDEYCQQQTGMTLTDYAAQRMAEDTAPTMEPTMQPAVAPCSPCVPGFGAGWHPCTPAGLDRPVGALSGRFGGGLTLTILVQDKAPGSHSALRCGNTAPQSGSGHFGSGVVKRRFQANRGREMRKSPPLLAFYR